MQHFVLECNALKANRTPYINKFKDILAESTSVTPTVELLLQSIMDCSALMFEANRKRNKKIRDLIESITPDMI